MAINIDFEEIQETLNNLDPENVGSWPLYVRAVIFVAAFVGVFFLGNYLFVSDMQAGLQAAKNKENKLLKEFEDKSFKSANLDEFRKQMDELDSSYGALLRQLPTDTQVPGLLDDITSTGLSSGLKFSSIGLAKEKDVEFYSVLPIDLVVKGSYHGLAGFISGVAGLPRIVTLHNFVIESNHGKKSGSGSRDLNMKIRAQTYRYKKDD